MEIRHGVRKWVQFGSRAPLITHAVIGQRGAGAAHRGPPLYQSAGTPLMHHAPSSRLNIKCRQDALNCSFSFTPLGICDEYTYIHV